MLKTQQIQIRDLEQRLDGASTELSTQRDLEQRVRELTLANEELRIRDRALADDLAQLHVRRHWFSFWFSWRELLPAVLSESAYMSTQKRHDDMVQYERSQQELVRSLLACLLSDIFG